MIAFISWYVLLTLLGWLTFPLAYYLFPALNERGYTFARAFGLLIWAYVFWLFASLGVAQNDIGGLLLGLVILGGLSIWALIKCQAEIQEWLRQNRRLIITAEILFIVAFGFMAFVRANNPEITGTEKPMELMFINGIMNSPTFPPRDLWLSGYSISYYYFGYVMASMLGLFTGVPATLAFNLMIALIFGLSAVGAYGILYNLLATRQASNKESESLNQNHLSSVAVAPWRHFFFPLLSPLFLLLISNMEGFLEVLHARGFLWKAGTNFWTWLDIPELRDVPTLPFAWVPDRFWWWWRASRVVQDYDLSGAWREVIDEFPFFSYLLSDLHPHVLAMPFNLLAVAVALNIFFGGWHGKIDLFFGELHINKSGFFTIALILGGLAFLNTWDILIAGALIVFSYALAQVHRPTADGGEAGWTWERVADIFLLGVPAVIVAFVMYLPFYVGFDSQAGGIVPNFFFVTRGAQIWVMWGTLFLPLFAYLLYLWRSKTSADWRKSLLTTFGLLVMLFLTMFVIVLFALKFKPDLVDVILQSQARDLNVFFTDSMLRRFKYIGGLLTMLALLIPALAFLFKSENHSSSFVLLMITLGALLIIGPDFLYLRDNFGYRINTVFKFYYQAWIVLSLAAAYAVVILFRNLRGVANIVFSVLLSLVLIVGLMYPVLGVFNKTSNFNPSSGRTLDDFDRIQRENPDEAAAILWLKSAPDGIVAEAVGNAYSNYARISIYTGLPTVLGWGNHEGQWRDTALQGSRKDDIQTLYTTSDWVTTQDILHRYSIRYIFVGNLERSTYPVNEEKFNHFLKPVFQQGSVTIYEAP